MSRKPQLVRLFLVLSLFGSLFNCQEQYTPVQHEKQVFTHVSKCVERS